MKVLLALLLCLLCAFTSSCTPSVHPEEQPYKTTSGTIFLETPAIEPSPYPSENPSAQDNPFSDSLSDEIGETNKDIDIEAEAKSEPETENDKNSLSAAEEVRAVWFSYLEFQSLLTGHDETAFFEQIGQAFDRVKDAGFNTVFVQVRPYGDALYRSSFFPWSHLITGEEGVDPGYDPLSVMIEEAHSRNLRIEAWINPYRIRDGNEEKHPLSAENPAVEWEVAGKRAVIRYEDGLYYNPSSEEARTLIVNGVCEIAEQYDIDGILFDDYFYPTTSETFDADDYALYRESGGRLSLDAWRRENVNLLIRSVYTSIKSISAQIPFGVSPQGNNDNNYDTQFIDTAKWLSQEGYVDYICPQIYFGFENTRLPYLTTLKEWNRMIKVDSIKLYAGLAPYKIGVEDIWAGEGADEWIENDDLLSRMVESAREQKHYAGFAMFRYQFLFEPEANVQSQVERELETLNELF